MAHSVSHTPLFSFETVSFAYHHQEVLQRVSLTIEAGDFVGIIGPNGSGKTTFIKLLLGLLQPTQGRVLFSGVPVIAGKQTGAIGYVPQQAAQHARIPLTVSEVVATGIVHAHTWTPFPTSAQKEIMQTALETVGMADHQHQLFSEISGGQQQRVLIAKALAHKPTCCIFDEPTVGVDQQAQTEFYSLLQTLHSQGTTIILVSHDIDVVVSQVNTVLCLNKTVVYHGSSHQFSLKTVAHDLYGHHQKFVIHDHHQEHS